MNAYLMFILVVLAADSALQWVVTHLNIRNIRPELPAEFKGWFDGDQYRKAQEYLAVNTRFEQAQMLVTLVIMLVFLIAGGFGWADQVARRAGGGLIITGLLFFGILMALSLLLQLPFQLYDTFVIEERFGFNRTTVKTFILDWVKSLFLGMVLGGVLLAAVLWFFMAAGPWGWAIAWGAVVVFQLIMLLLAPSLLLPLFNQFLPLPAGELRSAIEAYAQAQQVSLSGIYAIDGSRRSSKANAYVTGLGRLKRIALFDTLIEKHTIPELVAVLAHEVGHSKMGHIRRMLLVSVITTGFLFFLLSVFLREPNLYAAIQVSWPRDQPVPLYAGMMAFSLLMAPLNRLLSVFSNYVSRRHEFEADAFAARTTGSAEAMITALKKLSVENLSNLTPHTWMVWLEYSHPPVLERIKALRSVVGGGNTAT